MPYNEMNYLKKHQKQLTLAAWKVDDVKLD